MTATLTPETVEKAEVDLPAQEAGRRPAMTAADVAAIAAEEDAKQRQELDAAGVDLEPGEPYPLAPGR